MILVFKQKFESVIFVDQHTHTHTQHSIDYTGNQLHSQLVAWLGGGAVWVAIGTMSAYGVTTIWSPHSGMSFFLYYTYPMCTIV